MNRAFLLLLVTLVQSRSDGVPLAGPDDASENFEDGFQDFQREDWDAPDSPFPGDLVADRDRVPEVSKRSTGDAFARRSALDKNFMRFGRSPLTAVRRFCGRPRAANSERKPSFFRFGRGSRDNFIRFGRGGRDGFVRFGRGRPEDFVRAGRSARDDFVRFGRAGAEPAGGSTGDPFAPEYPEPDLENADRSSGAPGDRRTDRSPGHKEGRNGTNFLRFGKKAREDGDVGAVAIRRGERKRRAAAPEGREAAGDPELHQRATGYFEPLPENFPRRLPPLFVGGSWQSLEGLGNYRPTPFFPVSSGWRKSSFFGTGYSGPGAKRNQGGGSNFIRFG